MAGDHKAEEDQQSVLRELGQELLIAGTIDDLAIVTDEGQRLSLRTAPAGPGEIDAVDGGEHRRADEAKHCGQPNDVDNADPSECARPWKK
ncbi:MAG: hypothetical protein R3D02_11900 [Hyphomicrobiales bacterium]